MLLCCKIMIEIYNYIIICLISIICFLVLYKIISKIYNLNYQYCIHNFCSNSYKHNKNSKIIDNILNKWTLDIDQLRNYSDFKKDNFIELVDKDLCQLVILMKSKEWLINNESDIIKDLNNYIEQIKIDENYNFKLVKYHKTNKNLQNIARFESDNGSIIEFPPVIKHTLLKQSGYIKIDQVKTCPSIFLEIIRLNNQLESFPYLNAYIDNPQQQFDEMSEYYGPQLSNEQKKWLFNMVIHGQGSWETWYSRLTEPNDDDYNKGYKKITLNNNLPRSFEVGFSNESKKIIDIIFKNNEQLHNYLMHYHNTYKEDSIDKQKSILINYYIHVFENEALYLLFQYLKEHDMLKKIYMHNQFYWACSLEYDGLYFVPNKIFNNNIITEINSYVTNMMGIKINYNLDLLEDDNNIYLDLLHEFNTR